jgi:uncharacterized LabA/DUF88 family protein
MTIRSLDDRDDSDDQPSLRLAVLIDADNAQASLIEPLLAEVARYGEATVRRIYGDFTSSQSASWKKVLQPHAIKPVQQFAYTTGKNATDSALIIDAMDLLYTRRFDGFCLVTSDSDFTGLAMRLREAGLMVLGFGARKTPEAFRKACHRFVYTELLKEEAEAAKRSSSPDKDTQQRPKFPKSFMLTALDETSDDTGWANLGAFGSYLNKVQPDFDPRTYGFRKLSDLVKSRSDLFVVEERRSRRSDQAQLYLRAKSPS